MRIYTKAGDLTYQKFSFPDGQPHFKLVTTDGDFSEATIETRITSSEELLQVLLAADTLRATGYSTVNLDIRYLMGARMDRPIDSFQPATLSVITKIINGAGFNRVRILDPHSTVATSQLKAFPVLARQAFDLARIMSGPNPIAVTPDAGAVDRTRAYAGLNLDTAYFTKKRDSQTGKLSGFEYQYGSADIKGRNCLIIDDICDGGGTFIAIAKILKDMGAARVNLFVTHGIFSKVTPLEGIATTFCTDSYRKWHKITTNVVGIPVRMQDIP